MKLQIINHNDILFRDVLRAITVKSIAWPHPIESQLKWVVDNMEPDDMHVFLKEDGIDVAYMTLTPVKGLLNKQETNFLGVGCVCSAVKGRGYGSCLMQEVNGLLEKNNFKGLLFCREAVIKFYKKNNWQLVPQEIIKAKGLHEGVFTMVYNCEDVQSLEYADREF